MGFLTATPPPEPPEVIMGLPYLARIRLLAAHWVDHGAGLPKFVMLIYVAKMAAFAVCGIVVATLTSHLDPLRFAQWWPQPVVYQKLVVWVLLLEVLGVGGAWGPLCGHFRPMTGGCRYWLRRGTIRLPPWPSRVPLTAGDSRTAVDVLLYGLLIAALCVCLAVSGHPDGEIGRVVSASRGRLPGAPLIAVLVFAVLIGLRDKTIFLAARGEQWLPAIVFFAFFPFVDMIVAAKLLIVVVWLGAGTSKLNRHFEMVIPPMVSNTPWLPFRAIKRAHYAAFPDDLLPSVGARRLSHTAGAFGELVPPWILLFSHNHALTLAAVIFMVGYHAFIISTFPLAVPLEWNLMFMYLPAYLFLVYPAQHGFGVSDMGTVLLVVTVVCLLAGPVLGELFPRFVSFLPALRQYSGNWATSLWALAPGAEAKLDAGLVKPAAIHRTQLTEMFDEPSSDLMLHQYLAWRSMHSQGRGLHSVMWNQLGDELDTYDLRDGELVGNLAIGWNFGDGHLHDHQLVSAVQKRCGFEPGECVVVFAESDPIGRGVQEYYVVDAAVGIVERGTWSVSDAVAEQPWLPGGPIPTDVRWRLEGYVRARHGVAAAVSTA